MAQLLVRNLDDALVNKLKRRAREHGIPAEEEHRRLLREALSRPHRRKKTLVEFLRSPEGTVGPDVDLELGRSRQIESRDSGF